MADRPATERPVAARRGAVFFDRDGVLNVDHGYVHHPDQLEWTEDAVAAVKAVNDSGRFAFLVTNQSGVARGYYDEAAVRSLHAHMQAVLGQGGAHLDDIRYCPHHVEGVVEPYVRACDWRKPAPGMLLSLMAAWPVDPARSGMIGDNESDMQAAAAAGIRGRLFTGGSLKAAVEALLAEIGG